MFTRSLRHRCADGHLPAIGILSSMATSISTEDKDNHPKGPNFALVVVFAGIALALILIAAIIFLAVRGKKDVPLNHQHHTHVQNVVPSPSGMIPNAAVILVESA